MLLFLLLCEQMTMMMMMNVLILSFVFSLWAVVGAVCSRSVQLSVNCYCLRLLIAGEKNKMKMKNEIKIRINGRWD